MIRRINGQVRSTPLIINGEAHSGGVYGIDFGAVLAYAKAIGAPEALIADLLPDIEGILVRSQRAETEA